MALKEDELFDLIHGAPDNMVVQDAIFKCFQQVNNHEKNLVAVSGGRDSDIMMDLVIRCGGKESAVFAFFNTGLEYKATKNHLKRLEEKYRVEITILPPIKPIPRCVKEYGTPFWSKRVSDYISRLQSHGFKWEDEPFDVLIERYPKCKVALRWWCNDWPKRDNGGPSSFSIEYIPWLKEFMVENPPTFKISAKCCTYAKKNPVAKYMAENDFDLNCVGVRKAEGGTRATAYSNCYTQTMTGPDMYRPLFWFSDSDKDEYDRHYGIKHSDCYEVWGMKRTGCAGCPFGKNFEQELELAKKYEPNFHRAMVKLFGQSYDYTRRFLEYRAKRKNEKEARHV